MPHNPEDFHLTSAEECYGAVAYLSLARTKMGSLCVSRGKYHLVRALTTLKNLWSTPLNVWKGVSRLIQISFVQGNFLNDKVVSWFLSFYFSPLLAILPPSRWSSSPLHPLQILWTSGNSTWAAGSLVFQQCAREWSSMIFISSKDLFLFGDWKAQGSGFLMATTSLVSWKAFDSTLFALSKYTRNPLGELPRLVRPISKLSSALRTVHALENNNMWGVLSSHVLQLRRIGWLRTSPCSCISRLRRKHPHPRLPEHRTYSSFKSWAWSMRRRESNWGLFIMENHTSNLGYGSQHEEDK